MMSIMGVGPWRPRATLMIPSRNVAVRVAAAGEQRCLMLNFSDRVFYLPSKKGDTVLRNPRTHFW